MAKITFKEYMEVSARTAAGHENELVNYAMGVGGESGELVDLVKKFLFHRHDIDKDKVLKEAGDVLWYATQLLRILKIEISEAELFRALRIIHSGIPLLEPRETELLLMSSCMNLTKGAGVVAEVIDDYLTDDILNKEQIKIGLDIALTNVNFIITVAGLTMEEVAEANIEKLKRRYPKGFDPEMSINRVEE